MRPRFVAVAGGFILGGLLLAEYWPIEKLFDSGIEINVWWYMYLAALALIALGLGWIFPKAWLSAALGATLIPLPLYMLLSPLLLYTAFLGIADAGIMRGMIYLLADPALTIAVALTFGWIGSRIGNRWRRTSVARGLFSALILGGLAAGLAMRLTHPAHAAEPRRNMASEIPDLLRQINTAEISYSAAQPDKAFTCDANRLPKTGQLDWFHGYGQPTSVVTVGNYVIKTGCPQPQERPHTFCLWASPVYGDLPGPSYSIDLKGKVAEAKPADNPNETCPAP